MDNTVKEKMINYSPFMKRELFLDFEASCLVLSGISSPYW